MSSEENACLSKGGLSSVERYTQGFPQASVGQTTSKHLSLRDSLHGRLLGDHGIIR